MKSKKSAVRFSGASTDLLHNKYVLYLSFFFAVLTAARYLFNFNLEAIIIFVVLGFLTTYFSKNMIVILLTTTIGTNFIMMFKNKSAPVYYNIMEGMETQSGNENGNANGAAPTGPTAPADSTTATATGTGGAPAPNAGAASTANPELTKHMNNVVYAINNAKNGASGAPPITPTQAPYTATMPGAPEVAAFTKKNESMTQLSPASYGGSSGDNALSSMFSGMAAGATGQKNQAYDAMNSLGGSANTGNLLGQQTEMINNLKSIEPILNTAEKFLDKFENSSISKMFQNMGSIPGMSLLTGGGGNGGGNGLNPASVGS